MLEVVAAWPAAAAVGLPGVAMPDVPVPDVPSADLPAGDVPEVEAPGEMPVILLDVPVAPPLTPAVEEPAAAPADDAAPPAEEPPPEEPPPPPPWATTDCEVAAPTAKIAATASERIFIPSASLCVFFVCITRKPGCRCRRLAESCRSAVDWCRAVVHDAVPRAGSGCGMMINCHMLAFWRR
jgi:hypothetical protein